MRATAREIGLSGPAFDAARPVCQHRTGFFIKESAPDGNEIQSHFLDSVYPTGSVGQEKSQEPRRTFLA